MFYSGKEERNTHFTLFLGDVETRKKKEIRKRSEKAARKERALVEKSKQDKRRKSVLPQEGTKEHTHLTSFLGEVEIRWKKRRGNEVEERKERKE